MKVLYRFIFPDGSSWEYEIDSGLNGDSSAIGNDGEAPAWTILGFQQCPNCPLSPDEAPLCPVAEKLPPLVEIAGRLQSCDRLSVEVSSADRLTRQETSAQRALSSLFGLVMATSGCPHMKYFQPMARFHQPLSSEEETVYRASSMYLLAQYFRYRHGLAPDMSLQGLSAIYRELQTVNMSLVKRIRVACEKDAAVNALVLLDLLARGVPHEIEDSLEELRPMFSAYLE